MSAQTPTKSGAESLAFARAFTISVAAMGIVGFYLENAVSEKYWIIIESFAGDPLPIARMYHDLGTIGHALVVAAFVAIPVATLFLAKIPQTKIVAPCVAGVAIVGFLLAEVIALQVALDAILKQLK